jgi:hypothetical protein
VYAAAILVTDTLLDPEERLYGCMVIQICQTIIIACYLWTFTFSLLFRMVLIRFAERGLVERGKPNLLLFHQLYWTAFGTFSFWTIIVFTIMPLVQGTFVENPQNKICMLRPTEIIKSDTNITKTLVILVFILIITTSKHLITYKVRKYVSGLCPNGPGGAIGKYRKNLIDFEENSRYISYWLVYAAIALTARKLAMMFPGVSDITDITPDIVFRIAHGNALVFLWFVHGLILPLNMKIPWKSKRPRKASSFYVHKPLLPWMYPRTTTPPHPSRSTSLHSPHTLTTRSEFPPCLAEHWFRSPTPIPSPIPTLPVLLSQHYLQQQDKSHPMEEDRIQQTLVDSSLSCGLMSQINQEKEEKTWVNAVLMTALKKRKEGGHGQISDINIESFKCDVCSYECERYAILQKHKKANHGLTKCEINQKEDTSSVEENETLEPSTHPILSLGHRDRQPALVATAARRPQGNFYQIGIRYKRRHRISPLFVPEPPPSMHSPTPLLSSLPSSPPTRPALRSTTFLQLVAEIIGNHKDSRETRRYNEVRLTSLGGDNKGDLPSVD